MRSMRRKWVGNLFPTFYAASMISFLLQRYLGKCLFLRVEITLRGATYRISFSDTDQLPSLSELTTFLRYQGVEAVWLFHMWESGYILHKIMIKNIVNLGLKRSCTGVSEILTIGELVSAGHLIAGAALSRSDFSAPKSYFDQMVWLAWGLCRHSI